MPSVRELLIVCAVASVCAVTVVLVLHALGHGEHAVIAAAVSGSTSASVATIQLRSDKDESCEA